MNRILDDYIHALRRRLGHLPIRERDAVLDEVTQHLRDDMERRLKQDSGLSADEAALAATHAFGDPEEIGVAYGADGGVVNRSTGERLLDVAVLTGRAAGRGAKGLMKWTGIILGILSAVALILVIVGAFVLTDLADTYQDDLREAIPHPVYDYSDRWAAPNLHSETRTDSFQIGDRVKEFHISFHTAPQTGCVAIQLTSPSGQAIDVNGAGCNALSKETTYTEHGTWTIRYTYAAYTGSIDVEAYSLEDARTSG